MPFYTVKKKVDNAYLTREKDKRRSRDLAGLTLALAPLALFLLVYTWKSIELIRLGYENERLERRTRELSETATQLTLEAAALRSLDRVERRATAELGLAAPRPDQVVFLNGAGAGAGIGEGPR